MQFKEQFKVGDRVRLYYGNRNGYDDGVIVRYSETNNNGKGAWFAKWDSDELEQWFGEHENFVNLTEHNNQVSTFDLIDTLKIDCDIFKRLSAEQKLNVINYLSSI